MEAEREQLLAERGWVKIGPGIYMAMPFYGPPKPMSPKEAERRRLKIEEWNNMFTQIKNQFIEKNTLTTIDTTSKITIDNDAVAVKTMDRVIKLAHSWWQKIKRF